MPDWITYKDKDGNVYFLDKNSKIYTSGDPEFNYKSISVGGVNYYLEQGRFLYKRHHKKEALYLLKSLRYLADIEKKAYWAGLKAAEEINRIIKMEGSRFSSLDLSTPILLARKDKKNFLYNDLMNYELSGDFEIKVLKNNLKYYNLNHLSFKLLLGVKTEGGNKKNKGFDFLLTIYSEKFPYRLSTAAKYENIYRKRSTVDSYKREKYKTDKKEIIYKFKEVGGYNLIGYEKFVVFGKNSFYISLLSADSNNIEKYWKNIIDGLKFSFHDRS